MAAVTWANISKITAQDFTCGFCDREVTSVEGYVGKDSRTSQTVWLAVCSRCALPTLMSPDGEAFPAPRFGEAVDHLPSDVSDLYSEARSCMGVGAHTAAVLLARKLLMHVAAEQGAAQGLKFVEYIDYLVEASIVTPNMKPWIDQIRKLGNGANHELIHSSRKQGEEILTFTAMLLRLVYEYPKRLEASASAD